MTKPQKEQTGIQINGQASYVNIYDGLLFDRNQTTNMYTRIRELRKDPTIAFLRQVFIAPALLSGWSIKSMADRDVPEEAESELRDHLLPFRHYLLQQALYGCIDFGWAPFEKIFKIDSSTGYLRLRKLKQLLHDYTFIRVIPETGAYNGLNQTLVGIASQGREDEFGDIDIDVENTMTYYIDVEGTNWYGQGILEKLDTVQEICEDITAAAKRYDKKISGANWVIHYPEGFSYVAGTKINNYDIATSILRQIESSGGFVLPKDVSRQIGDLNEMDDTSSDPAWKVELITSSGATAASFTERCRYIDTLKVRMFGFPERTVLEGTHGTKSEAEAHGDIGLMTVHLRHTEMTMLTNWHLVNQLLRFNWGAEYENSIFFVANPLNDKRLAMFKDLFSQIVASPEAIDLLQHVDTRELTDALQIPMVAEEDIIDDVVEDFTQTATEILKGV